MTKSTEIAEDKIETRGRPPFDVTKEVLERVETLASEGLFKKQIAAILGIHYDTYNEKAKLFPDLPEAYTRGRGKGVGDVVKALFDKAKGGDVVAQKHYLKHIDKEHWGDAQTNILTGPEGGPIQTEITEVKVIRMKSVKSK